MELIRGLCREGMACWGKLGQEAVKHGMVMMHE